MPYNLDLYHLYGIALTGLDDATLSKPNVIIIFLQLTSIQLPL